MSTLTLSTLPANQFIVFYISSIFLLSNRPFSRPASSCTVVCKGLLGAGYILDKSSVHCRATEIPLNTHAHTQLCFWTVRESQKSQGKPMQAIGEHVNYKQKGLSSRINLVAVAVTGGHSPGPQNTDLCPKYWHINI